jgi:hypothetical protein
MGRAVRGYVTGGELENLFTVKYLSVVPAESRDDLRA